MLLIRYLAETGERSSLAGVIAISAMWDGNESMNGLERFPNKLLYSYPLSNTIRERVQRSVVHNDKIEFEASHIIYDRQVPQILGKFPALPYDIKEILKVNTYIHNSF